jgi:hypothetical protein
MLHANRRDRYQTFKDDKMWKDVKSPRKNPYWDIIIRRNCQMGQLSERDHCSTKVLQLCCMMQTVEWSKETAGVTHLAHTACEHALRVHDTDKAYCWWQSLWSTQQIHTFKAVTTESVESVRFAFTNVIQNYTLWNINLHLFCHFYVTQLSSFPMSVSKQVNKFHNFFAQEGTSQIFNGVLVTVT